MVPWSIAPMNVALRRLQSELRGFPEEPLIKIVQNDDDVFDMTRWRVSVAGAEGTLYEGEEFILQAHAVAYGLLLIS